MNTTANAISSAPVSDRSLMSDYSSLKGGSILHFFRLKHLTGLRGYDFQRECQILAESIEGADGYDRAELDLVQKVLTRLGSIEL